MKRSLEVGFVVTVDDDYVSPAYQGTEELTEAVREHTQQMIHDRLGGLHGHMFASVDQATIKVTETTTVPYPVNEPGKQVVEPVTAEIPAPAI